MDWALHRLLMKLEFAIYPGRTALIFLRGESGQIHRQTKTGPAEALLNDIRLTFGKRTFGKRRLKVWPGVANRAQSQRNGCAKLGTTTLSKLVSLVSQML